MFVSGNGTTLQVIIDAVNDNRLDVEINIVISNNKESYAIKRAEKAWISTYIIENKEDEDRLYEILHIKEIELIVLAIYLKLINLKIIKDFVIINTHPSLLPKYRGKGMYGTNVHKAVVDNHEKESGATLHFVNEEYHKGKIIAQTKVLVKENDTPLDLSERVQKI